MDNEFVDRCTEINGKILNNKCFTIFGGEELEVSREQVKRVRIGLCKNRNFECLDKGMNPKQPKV